MNGIALITICKGRLRHLKQTLPLMIAAGADEVIVVDYGCPDGTAEWVEANHPQARVIRVTDDPQFSATRSRNIGAGAARSQWLAFVDADVEIDPRWIAWMRENLAPGTFYRASALGRFRHPETFGTFICEKTAFAQVGGYDEAFRGWGGEDIDLFRRLAVSGVTHADYPGDMVTAIAHGNEERAGMAAPGSKIRRSVVTSCYTEAKMQLARNHLPPGELSLGARRKLMEHTEGKVQRWFESGATQPLVLRYVLNRGKRLAPIPHEIEAEVSLVMRIRTLDPSEVDPDDPFQVPME